MIKSELIARIAAQNPHLYERDVEALAEGDRVELRGFGAFEARRYERLVLAGAGLN